MFGGTLAHLLRNRFFIGEVKYRGEILPGEQPAIMDKTLFEAVQQKLSDHQSHKTLSRHKSEHLLKDLLFDDAGHFMIATHATKAGARYRYYVSRPGLHGESRTTQLGSISRAPAVEIEQVIVSSLKQHIASQNTGASNSNSGETFDHETLVSLVSRIEVQRTQLIISLKPTDTSTEGATLSIPWQKQPSRRRRDILLPNGTARESTRPERAERRARLVSAVARGRRWLEEITTGAIEDAEQLATRERCTLRQVNLTLSLAFLAPSLLKAAVEGRLPRGINIERLRDPDPNWSKQFQNLLDEIMTGAIKDSEQLAKRERCTVRQANLTLSLAFLAPPLVKAAVEGRLPRGINIERLRDPDPNWVVQYRDLGLNPELRSKPT